ncbi:hypothetical protein B0H15DRAFT_296797 [Mycena belliarum]|uniref:Uncharacterized protein n=1 Tax=Mycena belliarum TaxID=1033014 RepID=A0AAD6U7E2_9AGAR|nr:hypothetical protein B0H15DRAFT_296797 [Mycena belliae]
MPPRLPQELLNAVVDQAHDMDVLKACSLAGSVLRQPSQRILLRALTLRPMSCSSSEKSEPNIDAAYALLAESPHVASYAIILTVQLPHTTELPLTAEDVERFRAVVTTLTNLRQLFLIADMTNWIELSPPLLDYIVAFISRRPLHSLYLESVHRIPKTTFLQLAAAVPTLSVCGVQLNYDDPFPLPTRISFETLVLSWFSKDIYELLARPELISSVKAVRYLDLYRHYNYSDDILVAASSTVQRLRLSCCAYRNHEYYSNATQPTAFPSLRSLIITFTYWSGAVPCLVATLLQITATSEASPVLKRITVVSCPRDAYFKHPDNEALLAPLDAALTAHPAAPRLVLRFAFRGDDVLRAAQYADFVADTRAALPRTHAAGRVTFRPGRGEEGPFQATWSGIQPEATDTCRRRFRDFVDLTSSEQVSL